VTQSTKDWSFVCQRHINYVKPTVIVFDGWSYYLHLMSSWRLFCKRIVYARASSHTNGITREVQRNTE